MCSDFTFLTSHCIAGCKTNSKKVRNMKNTICAHDNQVFVCLFSVMTTIHVS